MARKQSFVPVERIEKSILLIRGQKVMLDKDLADLYGVETRVLKQAVRRNMARFPEDFMFELTEDENQALRSQNVTLKRGQHSKYPPFVFTEQGVAMLSSVLNSDRAIQVNIEIMRAFVRLRQMLVTHKQLARKLAELEQHLESHDQQIQSIFEAIRQLMTPSDTRRKRIGFEVKEPPTKYKKKKKAKKRK
jgi:phage regulator Rha-like protein